jgi:hypothetical protein
MDRTPGPERPIRDQRNPDTATKLLPSEGTYGVEFYPQISGILKQQPKIYKPRNKPLDEDPAAKVRGLLKQHPRSCHPRQRPIDIDHLHQKKETFVPVKIGWIGLILIVGGTSGLLIAKLRVVSFSVVHQGAAAY